MSSVNSSFVGTAASISSFSSFKSLPKYTELEKYFEIERLENEAAKIIQKSWRRTRVLLPWRHAVLCQRKAILIQKIARGILARKWVAEWFYTRNKIVIGWQAHSRRFIINKHTRVRLKLEKAMAIRIQRIVRGRIARNRCFDILVNMAATRIQILWRGVVARSHCDKLWLHRHTVIPIQNIYRRSLAIRKFKLLKVEYNQAALKIQKKFRNWVSCRSVGNALFAREMDYRMNAIRMLTAEEELCQEKLSKLMDRLIKNNSKHKAETARKALNKAEEDVYRRENDLIEIRRQMDIVTPRAMEAGFLEECEKNAVEIREDLTQLKIKHLFEASFEVFRCDDVLEEQVREIEEWALRRNKVSVWRQQEYEERLHLNYQRDTNQRRREKRIAIAEEKRRWQVLYFTRDGKPDKKRRPGQPWSADVFAGPEKSVYSGGHGVDLMANTRKGVGKKTGSVQSVDNTLNQISLQTYLDEVKMYEQMLNPITTIMQSTLGAPPGGKTPSQLGWGPEGDKLAPALQNIGALPPEWAEGSDSSTHGKNFISSNSTLTMNASQMKPKGILKKPSASLSRTSANKNNQSSYKAPHLETIQDDYSSVDGSVGTAEDFSSIGDMFRRSTRVRRKNQPRVTYLPSKESFSSSYRNNIRAVSSSNNALQLMSDDHHNHYEQEEEQQMAQQSMQIVRPSQNRRSSSALMYGGDVTAVQPHQGLASTNPNFSIAPLQHFSEVVPLVHSSSSRSVLSNSNPSKKKAKSRREKGGSTIPWELLDQLDGEKTRFNNEGAHIEFHSKL